MVKRTRLRVEVCSGAMSSPEKSIEQEYIHLAVGLSITLTKTSVEPTPSDEWHVKLDGRVGEEDGDDVEFGALPVLYVLGLLSFASATPRGASDIDYREGDDWTVADLLSHLRFEDGELHFRADYVRGRCMKTDVWVRKDGTFTLETVNRGQSATR